MTAVAEGRRNQRHTIAELILGDKPYVVIGKRHQDEGNISQALMIGDDYHPRGKLGSDIVTDMQAKASEPACDDDRLVCDMAYKAKVVSVERVTGAEYPVYSEHHVPVEQSH